MRMGAHKTAIMATLPPKGRLKKGSDDYNILAEQFRLGVYDLLQYNPVDIRKEEGWESTYEDKAFRTSVERLCNELRMEKLAEIRRNGKLFSVMRPHRRKEDSLTHSSLCFTQFR